VILLPVAAERWPASLVRSVLAHESAHVRRRDHLVQSLGGFACAVFWFHPLAWMALRRLRMAGERAADERTISSGIPPRVYAAHLVDVARASWGQAGLSGGLGMVRRSELEHRIVAILDPSQPRPAAEPRVLTGLVVAFAALVVALAAIRIHIG
jgi:beta-lactamase regulating signal transducer with metallopeptidase domain